MTGQCWVMLKSGKITWVSLHHNYKSCHCFKLEKIVTRNHFQDNFCVFLCLEAVYSGVEARAGRAAAVGLITTCWTSQDDPGPGAPQSQSVWSDTAADTIRGPWSVNYNLIWDIFVQLYTGWRNLIASCAAVHITTTWPGYQNVIVLWPMNGSVSFDQTTNNHPVTFTKMTSADVDSFYCWQEFV